MRAGWTLTELVMGMAVSAILMLTVGMIAQAGISSHTRQSRMAERYNDITTATDLIERTVRKGGGIVWNPSTFTLSGKVSNDTATFDFGFTWNPSSRNLTFSTSSSAKMTPALLTNVTWFSVTESSGLFNVSIVGNQDGVNYTRSFSVFRRNM